MPSSSGPRLRFPAQVPRLREVNARTTRTRATADHTATRYATRHPDTALQARYSAQAPRRHHRVTQMGKRNLKDWLNVTKLRWPPKARVPEDKEARA